MNWTFAPSVSSNISIVRSSIRYLRLTCLEGRNLCTPPAAVIEERDADHYHVVLPAHLEWGASIPNPAGKTVEVSGVLGSVCWDLASYPACGGPDGAAPSPAARPSLVAPERNPGALVVKTDRGRTWFSVNDQSGGAFKANEGFFEFDVRLK